jgi:hypothetical protein
MKLVAAIARGRRWLGELITDLATAAHDALLLDAVALGYRAEEAI